MELGWSRDCDWRRGWSGQNMEQVQKTHCTVEKVSDFPVPVSDIPAGDGKIANLFYSAARKLVGKFYSFSSRKFERDPVQVVCE
jgi:hypothetical protein